MLFFNLIFNFFFLFETLTSTLSGFEILNDSSLIIQNWLVCDIWEFLSFETVARK